MVLSSQSIAHPAQLGIGSTYNSHPVALASAYAALKACFIDWAAG